MASTVNENAASNRPEPDSDPLEAFGERAWHEVLYPYGFPLRLSSNSAGVIAAARRHWGALEQRYETQPLEVRLTASPGGTAGPLEEPLAEPVFRAQGNLLVAIANPENFWCADLLRGFAFGRVSAVTMERAEYFRFHFLEGMVYCLLDTLHMVMLHAACVSWNGSGILLAGDSGAGKSSLSYACVRRGWTYTSDDASCLVRDAAEPVVQGDPRLFRLRDSAGDLFPEFRDLGSSRRGSGKPTIEIPTESLPGIETATESRIAHIVFLNRQGDSAGPPEMRPVSSTEAVNRLFARRWPDELPANSEHRAAIERLARVSCWELRYRDLGSAVDALQRLARDNET